MYLLCVHCGVMSVVRCREDKARCTCHVCTGVMSVVRCREDKARCTCHVCTVVSCLLSGAERTRQGVLAMCVLWCHVCCQVQRGQGKVYLLCVHCGVMSVVSCREDKARCTCHVCTVVSCLLAGAGRTRQGVLAMCVLCCHVCCYVQRGQGKVYLLCVHVLTVVSCLSGVRCREDKAR